MSAEGQCDTLIYSESETIFRKGILHMYTGNYECLELFVKPEAGKKVV